MFLFDFSPKKGAQKAKMLVFFKYIFGICLQLYLMYYCTGLCATLLFTYCNIVPSLYQATVSIGPPEIWHRSSN